jgi:cell migration-inducing and hyaluronan-binding protein
VSGVPNSYILINDGVNDSIAADAQACQAKPEWNATVCKGDVGRLSVGNVGGGPGGPGGGFGAGPPGGGGAAPAPAARPAAPSVAGAAAPPPRPAGGGFGFGGPPGPPPPPVVLSRNGKDYTLTQSNVRAGTEIKLATERPAVNLSLAEMDAGSWVIFELPGFTKAAAGEEQSSLDALRKANATSYYKGKDALWVKVVSNGTGAQGASPGTGTSLQVSR